MSLHVQVEHVLFPELGGLLLELPSVGLEEALVTAAREEALSRLRSNLIGPHRSVHLVQGLDIAGIFPSVSLRYVGAMYDQHRDLLDGQALRKVEDFLKSDAELPAFGKVWYPVLERGMKRLVWKGLGIRLAPSIVSPTCSVSRPCVTVVLVWGSCVGQLD